MKRVDAILCADLHIREDSPVCRTDNFFEAQTRKLEFISKLQKKYDCPVLCAGDVFDKWKNSPFLLSYAIRNLPDNMIAVAGNHDLASHSMENLHRSSIDVLAAAGKLRLLNDEDDIDCGSFVVCGFPWGSELEGIDSDFIHESGQKTVALMHYLVYQNEPPFPGAEKHGGNAKTILRKMKGFDLIVSGDCHQTCVERVGNRALVNSGSLMRTTAAQVDYVPQVFLWNAATNEIEGVNLPCESNVVSREHIEIKKQRDDRIESFVSNLKQNVEVGLSFSDNISKRIAADNISKPVQKLIYTAMGV